MVIQKLAPYWQDKEVHRKVWALAWPMILSNLTIPLLGLVDTAVMGHLDSSIYMGAVAVGSIIIGVVIWACNFLRMGTTGFASQALGQNNHAEIHAIIWRSVFVAQVIAITLILLKGFYADLAFYFIDGTDEVKTLARSYFDIRVWGLPASIASFAIIGWFLGLHNTRIPLLLLIVTNSLNIILDIVFVLGLGWNVEGAALASLISEYTSLLLGLYFVFREFKKYSAHSPLASVFNGAAMFKMFSVNRDIFIRTMALELVLFMIAAQGAKLGNDILAANAVLLNFLFLITNGLDGLAQAIEAMVGKAIGAKDLYHFNAAIVVASGWSLLLSIAYLLTFAIVGDMIIGLLTNIETVKVTANIYLPWLIILPINGVWSYILDGIFIGATRAKEMRDSMVLATFLGFIPVWWLLQPLENHGIWLAFHLFMLIRAILLGLTFWRMHKNAEFIG
ncbi:MAG: MATE family efflux transporter [Gammaproteobacteria bacterium]|nr:MATE family efflux transporter [Gammaproteobacteria bacterium]